MRCVTLSLLAIVVTLTCKDGAGPGPAVTNQVVVNGPAVLFLGQIARFTATALDSHGDTLLREITWSSSDATVVTITQAGLATTQGVGVATITAAADAKSGNASLTVRLVPVLRVDVAPNNIDSMYVGDSLQLAATPRDSAGGILTRAVTWSTSDTAKATVTQTGFVRTHAPGSFTVTAASEGRAGGVFLNAHLRAASLTMPDSLTLSLRQVVRLTPELESASGTPLSSRAVSWISSDPATVTVDQLGVIRPQRLGTATITARADSLADSSAVRVVPEPVALILISTLGSSPPADTTLEMFEAWLYDRGSAYTVGDIVWSSSDTTVMAVAPSPTHERRGHATGHRPGTIRITATSGGVSGFVDYTLMYPMVRLIVQPDSVMVPVGEARSLSGVGVDRFGNGQPTSISSQGMTSADSTVARVLADASIYGVRPGRTPIVVQLANGRADTVPVIVPATSAPRLRWSAAALSPPPYSQIRAQLVSTDSTGQFSSIPREVRITSTDTTVAMPVDTLITIVAVDSIRVETRRPGFATVIAGDSLFTSLPVSVVNVPPTVVLLDSTPPALRVGDATQLDATVRGSDGVLRPYPVTWTSSDESRAVVSASGAVTAQAIGDVAIVAASGAARDTAMFTILSTAPPAVADISPNPLVPGAVVTIRGSGFDPDPAANSILIDSVAVTVTAASDNELTVVLPTAAAWSCTATHRARILINSGGRLGMDSVPLSVATQRPGLAAGAGLSLTGTDAACNELAPAAGNAMYVLSIANADQSTPVSFTFRGDGSSIARAPGSQPDPSRPIRTTASRLAPISLDSLKRAATFHRRLLDKSRALVRRAGAPAPLLRAARQQTPQGSVPATINGVARVRIPRLEDPDFCASYQSIDANVVYAGTHVVMLEDKAAPLAGMLNTLYQMLGTEFENVMYPKLLANFGNPLSLDSLLDRDGRIAMVFSPAVNRYGVAGFVVSCDFYPESVAPSSNTGEIFYAQVPTYPGGGFDAYTAEVWWWLMRSVVMHESKHLTAVAERLNRGSPLEETWLEESSAVLAEELWSRSVYGTTWKGDASYRSTLYCDVRPTFPECLGKPYTMFNAYAFLYDYLTHLESRTPLGPTGLDDASFYGSGWSFLRWTVDQYAGSESDFLRQLVSDPRTGVANLSARAQRPFDELLADWSDAMYFDSWALVPANQRWRMPSWNVGDIIAGMRNDFPSDFPDARPLRGRVWPLGSSFSLTSTNLPPGGWALFVADGMNASTQLFDIRLLGDAPPPPSLRIQLVRLR